jgi:acetone carboxylase gamma subunit
MYQRTYSPDPTWCRILEYYCSQCGTMVEAEYLPPGHPPLHDIELDIDVLKEQWKGRKEVEEPAIGPDLALEKVKHGRALHAEHGHKH